MEYGNIMFDSGNQEDLDVLTSIEKEALRTITGARARCNIESLYNEVKWPSLEKRREIQKIAVLGKIIIKRFPSYLLEDLPTFYANARHNRKNKFASPAYTKDYYKKSFVPASVELWNNLPVDFRCINSYKALKSRLKRENTKKVPVYFNYGTRSLNILHTKLRLGCSDLNADKFLIGISNTNKCQCGEIESAQHYLLECGINLVAKVTMLDSITDILLAKGLSQPVVDDMLGVDLLLKGHPTLSINENERIFKCVQIFIGDSKRFI